MQINSLTLINYRKFEHQSFGFNRHFTALIGDNASGKTQILNAIVKLLSQYQFKMLRLNTYRPSQEDEASPENHCEITPEDAHHETHFFANPDGAHQLRQEPFFPVILSATLDDGEYAFCRRDSEADEANARSAYLTRLATEALESVKSQQEITLPVLAYYGTSRLWNKKNRPKTGVPSRTDGYRWSLDGFVDFDELKEWFRDQELIQLQKNTNGIVLKVMRKALAKMIEGCEDVFYDLEAKSIVLHFQADAALPFEERSLLFEDLSDGYRMILTLVFDLVKQMFLLNPQLGYDTLEKTDGIVLIDELDLSLHPKWQRKVVDSLKETFPQVQFIVTTHSPFVLQSLEPGEVIDLESCTGEVLDEHWTALKQAASEKSLCKNECRHISSNDLTPGMAWPGPAAEYARKSVEDVVEEVMQVELPQRSERLTRMYNAAKEYYALLEQAKDMPTDEIAKLKDRLDELSAPFSQDVAYYAYLEFKRQMALGTKEVRK